MKDLFDTVLQVFDGTCLMSHGYLVIIILRRSWISLPRRLILILARGVNIWMRGRGTFPIRTCIDPPLTRGGEDKNRFGKMVSPKGSRTPTTRSMSTGSDDMSEISDDGPKGAIVMENQSCRCFFNEYTYTQLFEWLEWNWNFFVINSIDRVCITFLHESNIVHWLGPSKKYIQDFGSAHAWVWTYDTALYSWSGKWEICLHCWAIEWWKWLSL